MVDNKISVLQVTGGVGQGGFETAAINIVRHMA